ncbi:MAG TPA: hypothetical protein VGF79_11925 [Bacteroidia bacterium]
MLLFQSCGVIEKRRYSWGWNLNLNLGGTKFDGPVKNHTDKKKTISKLNQANEPESSSINLLDTTSFSKNVWNRHIYNNDVSVNRDLSSIGSIKQFKHFNTSKTVSKSHEKLIESSKHCVSASNKHGHYEELKNEPFSVVAAIAFLLAIAAGFIMLMSGVISSLLLYTLMYGVVIGVMCTFVSVYFFKTSGDAFKNKGFYIFDNIMLIFALIGLLVYVEYLISSF